jgi:hypothetical protein
MIASVLWQSKSWNRGGVALVIPHRWYALLSTTILSQLRYQMQPSSDGRIDLLGKGEKVKQTARNGCRLHALISPKFFRRPLNHDVRVEHLKVWRCDDS